MLEKVLGPGQAIVRVSAEINYDTISKTEEKFDPDGQVIRSQTKNDENTDSMTATSSSPVGISANTATESNTTATAASPVTNSKNHKSVANVEYEIGKTTSSTMLAAGGIKRLSVAVTVAAHTEGTGADRKVVTRTPEEIDKLRRIVTTACGVETGTDNTRGDAITLEELPFNDQFAADLTRELDVQQKHDMWWNLARTASYPALGLIALLILLRIFKRAPIPEIPIGVPVGRLMARANGNGNGNGNGHKTAFEGEPGVVTVDVLNRLIKENPTNMTQAIRDWMNKSRAQGS
jgi:flagellar M-ring protein FliF